MDPLSWRDQTRDRLIASFGPPLVLRVNEGEIYRWVLKRPHGVDLYITLDAPEMPQIVHLMISDPYARFTPVQSIIVRTAVELEAIIEQIRAQWKIGAAP